MIVAFAVCDGGITDGSHRINITKYNRRLIIKAWQQITNVIIKLYTYLDSEEPATIFFGSIRVDNPPITSIAVKKYIPALDDPVSVIK